MDHLDKSQKYWQVSKLKIVKNSIIFHDKNSDQLTQAMFIEPKIIITLNKFYFLLSKVWKDNIILRSFTCMKSNNLLKALTVTRFIEQVVKIHSVHEMFWWTPFTLNVGCVQQWSLQMTACQLTGSSSQRNCRPFTIKAQSHLHSWQLDRSAAFSVLVSFKQNKVGLYGVLWVNILKWTLNYF